MLRQCLISKGQYPAFIGCGPRSAVCLEKPPQRSQRHTSVRNHPCGFPHSHACLRENLGKVIQMRGYEG